MTNFRITTVALRSARVGDTYREQIVGAYGFTPYTWSVVDGVLPDGLTLNAATGELAGTPTVEGTFEFVVQGDDGHDPATVTLAVGVLPALDVSPFDLYLPQEPYATIDDLVLCGCKGFDLNVPEDLTLLRAMLVCASRRVFTATAGKYLGPTDITIRPCRPELSGVRLYNAPGDRVDWTDWWPTTSENGYLPQGDLWSPWCGCGSSCACAARPWIPLPIIPVRSIIEVVIDGQVVDPATYFLRTGTNELVRVGGLSWPFCQEEKPLGEVGTWSVKFSAGWSIPPEAKPLIAAYACELAKRCRNLSCALPTGTRVIRRTDIDFEIEVSDPLVYRKELLTGYVPLDDWIVTDRGGHAIEQPRVYLPGISRQAGGVVGT